jgi:ribosomal peptide maturation radical SAM protein 1
MNGRPGNLDSRNEAFADRRSLRPGVSGTGDGGAGVDLPGTALLPGPPAVTSVLRAGDALIIVPPFGGLGPSPAAHLLQSCAREAGIRVSVLYANCLWASVMGEARYADICRAEPRFGLIGERIFAAAAYGGPPLGRDASSFLQRLETLDSAAGWPDLVRLAVEAGAWADRVADGVAHMGFRAVGCTTTFEQTSASVALLDRIKARRPECVTMIGGANCEGDMAEGIRSLGAAIDVVFSGESERTFVAFMRDLLSGRLPARPVVSGAPCMDLDGLPLPALDEFFEQRARFLPHSPVADGDTWLPVETSRGCWWGEKHHCTFCGCNASGMRFRAKSPDRVISELATLSAAHHSRKVMMTDRIMPRTYLHSVIRRLPAEIPGLSIHYEQKANLSLSDVLALKQAGVTTIQPGIEALSSSLLRRMRKGVSAAQNIALLRYARSATLGVGWNLLSAFPGDQVEDYEQTLMLCPLMHHLYPPVGLTEISVHRFSPYFDEPASYGVTNIRPVGAYTTVFPAQADSSRLAYYFDADYQSAARDNPGLNDELRRQVARWHAAWGENLKGGCDGPPLLMVRRISDQAMLLNDTRGLAGTSTLRLLDREQASLALVGRPYEPTPALDWALAQRIGVVLDGFYVPLATADPALLQEFERERRTPPAPSDLDHGPLVG